MRQRNKRRRLEISFKSLVSWQFEPSQPRTSGLKTIFNLSPIYRQVIKPKIIQSHKISPDTNLQKTYTNIKHKIFEELVPSVLPLLNKHIWLGHAGIVGHSVDLSIPERKSIRKEWTEAIKKMFLIVQKCITTNSCAIWQHAVHITDQLISPSC